MTVSPTLLRVAAITALGSVLTTLAVHLLPWLWADVDTFEEQLGLPNNPLYMGRLWAVLIHCALVVVSMFGIAALKFRDSPGLAGLGFLSYFVFALCEMLRTSISLFAMNRRWRPGYSAATDESTRASLKATMDAFAGINDALFFLFYVAFCLGVFCYGLMLVRDPGHDGKIGWLFLLWAALGIPAFIDTVLRQQLLGPYFSWVGNYFLPVARALVGIWLWQKSNSLRLTTENLGGSRT